jgi:hypothetical protein
MSIQNKDELLKRCLFIPCESKDDLHRWIRVYLNFDMPNIIVHPESTSTPMDFIWEVYSKARADDDPSFTRVMAYSCRDGYKTLSASILEVLLMAHCERSTGHLAALETQAGYALGYVKNFLSKPYLRDFVVGDNKREIELLRYEDPVTKFSYSQKEFKELPSVTQNSLIKKHNYIKIVICTRAGANGLHAPSMVIDEVDLAKNDGYEEAQLIPGPWGVKYPITTLVSTRKSSIGLVQKEIDNANKSGLQIRHWNIIDVTEACPPKRHKPDEPKKEYYINDSDLAKLDVNQYEAVDDKTKAKFRKIEAFSGCDSCSLLPVCEGLLATKQRKEKVELPTINLLKSIDNTIASFNKVSHEMAQAQLMCRKPESTGLIYPKLDKEVHMISANQMFEIMTGEKVNKFISKEELVQFLIKNDARFYTGMDFGWAHDFAAVTGAVWGNFFFVIDSIAVPGLELDEKIVACDKIKEWGSIVFPDPEDPASAATFRRKGFKIRKWNKEKGSVKAGIEIVRTKLKSAIGGTTLFFLKDDEGCNNLVRQMIRYHFKQDAAGNITDEPDKDQDDSCDALRYAVMNIFTLKGKVVAAIDENPVIAGISSRTSFDQPQNNNVQQQQTLQREMQSIINGFVENPTERTSLSSSEEGEPKNKSKFIWDI